MTNLNDQWNGEVFKTDQNDYRTQPWKGDDGLGMLETEFA